MVEKIFWDDPYLTRLASRLASITGNTVTLDRAIFYAFSGGQECDYGSIGGLPLGEARKQPNEIGEVRLKRKNPGKGKERVVSAQATDAG